MNEQKPLTPEEMSRVVAMEPSLVLGRDVTRLIATIRHLEARLAAAIAFEESRRKKEAEDRELMQRVVAIFLSAKEALDRPLPLTMPHDPFWREWRRTAGEVAADLSRLCDMEGR